MPIGSFLSSLALPPPSTTIVNVHCDLELLNDLCHVVLPFLFSPPLQACLSHLVFIAPAFLIRQVCQFHGLEDVVNDQGRAKSRAQTQKKHPTPLIGAQRLHSCVIDFQSCVAVDLHQAQTLEVRQGLVRPSAPELCEFIFQTSKLILG